MKIDIKKLKGIDLYYYLTSDEYPDKDFSENVSLLIYAKRNKDEALKLLEDVVEQGKHFVAVYPGNGDAIPKGAELVGDIPDGALYVL